MPCHETLKIVNKQVSHQTFKHASTAFIQDERFCDFMFFPLLQHKHFILYVLNNCEDKFICYDSRNVSKDTRQTLINHGLAFADFFKSGKIKRGTGKKFQVPWGISEKLLFREQNANSKRIPQVVVCFVVCLLKKSFKKTNVCTLQMIPINLECT